VHSVLYYKQVYVVLYNIQVPCTAEYIGTLYCTINSYKSLLYSIQDTIFCVAQYFTIYVQSTRYHSIIVYFTWNCKLLYCIMQIPLWYCMLPSRIAFQSLSTACWCVISVLRPCMLPSWAACSTLLSHAVWIIDSTYQMLQKPLCDI